MAELTRADRRAEIIAAEEALLLEIRINCPPCHARTTGIFRITSGIQRILDAIGEDDDEQ